MSLRPIIPGTSRTKALADMTSEEAQPWLAERLASLHSCTRAQVEETLAVATNIGANTDAAHCRAALARLKEK